jgi:RNA polymerase sigma factor (TIGR02999 family)
LSSLTQLIEQASGGDAAAREALFSAAYSELRKLARARLYRSGHSTLLDTTSLVHEAYIRYAGLGQLRVDDRRAFFAYASKVMRSVVIDAVRERQALRRGGDADKMTLDTSVANGLPSGEEEIVYIHDALLALEEAAPRLAKVVEMRYFGGYSEAEIAETLGLTERTVRRDWDKARLLLMDALRR